MKTKRVRVTLELREPYRLVEAQVSHGLHQWLLKYYSMAAFGIYQLLNVGYCKLTIGSVPHEYFNGAKYYPGRVSLRQGLTLDRELYDAVQAQTLALGAAAHLLPTG